MTDLYYRPGYERLWGWFGLSYASFLTLPRVFMHEMPDEWQNKMATLLQEFDAAFDTRDLPNTTVRATKNGKLVKMPDFIINYRHPGQERIEACKTKKQ